MATSLKAMAMLGLFAASACMGSVSGDAVDPGLSFDELPAEAPEFNDPPAPPPPAGVAVSVMVDRHISRHPVNVEAYGVNYGTDAVMQNVAYPVRRWGGNATSRYNWELDVSNRGLDWFFLGVAEDGDVDVSKLPNGSSADTFVSSTLAANGRPIITIPTIGWVGKDREVRWGYSVAKYGAQQSTECAFSGFPDWCRADAGNGTLMSGTRITGNDPNDTSKIADEQLAKNWIAHLKTRFGSSARGGVRYYALDNEPTLWNEAHRDVHPNGLTYDELWEYTLRYGKAVKEADPDARILGPAEWGWCGYLDSSGGCGSSQDRKNHGDLPMLAWYLKKVCDEQAQSGVRVVDYLDVHFYPQATGVTLSDDESPATQALRFRSLNSLYDASYVDESWIGQPVNLIPMLKGWIASNCPGTKIAITEYQFGNDWGISAALAQAEALAIFGREGVDLATRWVAPEENSFVEDAFKMFLSYDGNRSRVIGWNVSAPSSNPASVGSYAIERSDGGMYVILVNHDATARDTYVGVPGMQSAIVYGFDAAQRYGERERKSAPQGGLRLTLPALSATLVKLSR